MAQFERGHGGGPGRPLGSRNKLGQQLLDDLLDSWQQHGKRVLDTLAKEDAATYANIVAKVLPRELAASVRVESAPPGGLSAPEWETMLAVLRLIQSVPGAADKEKTLAALEAFLRSELAIALPAPTTGPCPIPLPSVHSARIDCDIG